VTAKTTVLTMSIRVPIIQRMDVVHRLSGIDFVWDQTKAKTNTRKHGIKLETACEVFFDPFVLHLEAETIDGEERETIVGLTVRWKMLVVIYTLREDLVRLISARSATGPERNAYENQQPS
jgi:uncharacterized protein